MIEMMKILRNDRVPAAPAAHARALDGERAATALVWTIAGSDSCGGAGIQADLKAFNSLGIHGCSVVTALTAQNTQSVELIDQTSNRMLQAQIDALRQECFPQAVKTGMLWNSEQIRIVAAALEQMESCVVVDPVLISTSNKLLTGEETISALVQFLLPRADVITPNIFEAHAILGRKIENIAFDETTEADAYLEILAQQLVELGARSVMLKGGHREGSFSQDYWTNGKKSFWLTNSRVQAGTTHGTGCTLSAAIAASLAGGHSLEDAMVIGKAYTHQAISRAPERRGMLWHGNGALEGGSIPWLTKTAQAGRSRLNFAPLDRPMGFYPIVDSVAALSVIVDAGLKTAQLRIKRSDDAGTLASEIKQAIELADRDDCRLFINDHWQLAIEHNAYGVHLGQEDLLTADLASLAKNGLRLGISSHCYEEVAVALSLQPSYIAIGPIFPTTTKVMHHPPQGLAALRRWKQSLNYPLVAIGGMFLHNAKDVLDTGVESIAVVRDLTQSSCPRERTKEWLRLFEKVETNAD